MNEPLQLNDAAEQLATAARALENALAGLNSGQQELAARVDRIVAAIEETGATSRHQLEARVAELERANTELRTQLEARAGQPSPAARKTVPPLVTALLAKNDFDGQERLDAPALEKALNPLSLEQRIAVKAELARAGFID